MELSLLGSPAMMLVGGVVAMLYGLVLFSVVSSNLKRQQTEPEPSPEPPVALAHNEPSPAPAPAPASRPPAEPAATPSPAVEKAATPAPAEPPKTKDVSPPGKTKEVAKAPTPPATPAPAPTPAPAAVAKNWGPLAGDPGDCTFRPDGDTLGILIPPALHILSPDLNLRNAPKLLTAVTGDFVAQVKVAGRILPGTDPLPKLPFTFQGAGLLLWQDADHYLRLERTASYNPSEGKKYHQILVELCRGGRVASTTTRSVTETDLMLQFDRRGNEVRCRYSPDDGKTWLELKRQPVPFPAQVSVGVSAANASVKPFTVVLQDFKLSGAGARGARP